MQFPKRTRIAIADDHPLMRQALKMWFEEQEDFQVVAEVEDGESAVRCVKELCPDIVIMDISMPKLNGIEAAKQILSKFAGPHILIFTVHDDEAHIIRALQVGAEGYLTKDSSGDEVVQAVRRILKGEKILYSMATSKMADYLSQQSTKNTTNIDKKLSTRELDVLKLIARGDSNKDIALKLCIGLRSVKSYVTNLFLKLGVESRTEAIAVSLQTGLLSIDDLNNEIGTIEYEINNK